MEQVDYINNAKRYLELGFSIIPVGQDKRPLVKWEEFQHRKPSLTEIKEWVAKFPNANIGIVTGDISGTVVVDIEAGGKTDGLPPTAMAKTGGGGWHFFYKHPGFEVKNAVRVRELTDIRGDGGYVVAAPSTHTSGNQYEWLAAPEDCEMVEVPEWVLESLKGPGPRVSWQEFMSATNPKGKRNMTAAQLAGKLLHHLPTDLWDAGWAAFKDWNASQNNPPLSEDELRRTWESIQSKELPKRTEVKEESASREPISFEELERAIGKWLLLADKGIIKIITAAVIANRLNADPVWLFIVTSSGGTKTELLRGLNLVQGIYPLSDLTPQTFLSGDRGNKSASLLLRLPEEVILTLKDFTTVLTMHRDKRHAILSQLREIYDGSFKKEFGTGETREWNGKLGFMAGVTSVVDHHSSVYQTLGERFIQYRPTQPDPIKLSLKAINNSGNEVQMREEIQNAFAAFIEGIEIPSEPVAVPDDVKHRIAHLAAFCVRARSGVIREGHSSREIELIPEVEQPTRLSKQLITLYSALSLISGAFTEEDYSLVYKVGMDSLPKTRWRIMQILRIEENPQSTAEIATRLGYPTTTARRTLEDLHGLGLLRRDSQGSGKADLWSLRTETRELLAEAEPSHEELLQAISEVFFDGKGVPEMSEGLDGVVLQEGGDA